MALARYIVTNTTTVAAGTFTADSSGTKPGTGFWAGPSGAWAAGVPVTFLRGQVVELDPAAGGGLALYNAIGSANLRLATTGTDDVGREGLSN